MSKKAVAALSAALALGLGAAVAAAHVGNGQVSCTQALFNYSGFVDALNTVTEQVLQDGSVLVEKQFSFQGTSGSDTIALKIEGQHTLQARASWNTNSEQGSFTGDIVRVDCERITTTVTDTATITNNSTTTVMQPGPTTTVSQVAAPVTIVSTATVTTTGPTTTVTSTKNSTTTVVKTKTKVRRIIVRRPCPSGTRLYRRTCHMIARGQG